MSSTRTPTPPGHFHLLYFATAASYTGKPSEFLKAPLPIAQLFDVLEERYPGVKRRVLASCAVTVNLEYVDVPTDDDDSRGDEDDDDQQGQQQQQQQHQSSGRNGLVIQEGDEVAIIPPVSSG